MPIINVSIQLVALLVDEHAARDGGVGLLFVCKKQDRLLLLDFIVIDDNELRADHQVVLVH